MTRPRMFLRRTALHPFKENPSHIPVRDYFPIAAQHRVFYTCAFSSWSLISRLEISFFLFVFPSLLSVWTRSPHFVVKKFQATFLADGYIFRLLLPVWVEGVTDGGPRLLRAKEKDGTLERPERLMMKYCFFFFPIGLVMKKKRKEKKIATCYCWWGRMRETRREKWL